MVKIAILEHEKETKDIIFKLAGFFKDTDWTFRHFFKASELAKRIKEEQYQIFIFDEIFKSARLESVFVHDNPSSVFVYVCKDPQEVKGTDMRERIHYISKDNMNKDLDAIREALVGQAKQKENYLLTYNGVQIEIPIEDIYYMEKVEKNVYFYTKKGEFHRRINLSSLEDTFTPFGFKRVHVSYLVNGKYITATFKDEVEINHSIRVPLSRAQKKKLGMQVRNRL
ncbi:MAG: LytTR family transcriptional regulator [Ileibacterium sp.]|nr:LytTR family transcriptional regulator [Ileibacterium sp.]